MTSIDELPEGEEFREAEFADETSDDESLTVECPNCGKPVFEDAELCPSCGNYVTHGPVTGRKELIPWWVILGLILVGALVLVLVFGR